MLNKIKFVFVLFFLTTSAQAAMTVTYNPPLATATIERFTVQDGGGNDVTSNYTIQSIAPDAISGYTPAKTPSLFRSMRSGSYVITYVSNIDSSTFTDTANFTAPVAYVQLTSGSNQSANTGTALPQPIKVQVSDASGNPIPGVTVTWTITGSGGTFSPTITDSNGIASTTLTLGSIPGVYNVSVSAGSVFSTDTIQENALPSANQLTSLTITTQPSAIAQQLVAFPSQPILSLKNGSNAAYTTPTTVNVSAYSNSNCSIPSSGSLSGTTSVQSDASGNATFSNLSYSNVSGIYLRFQAGSLIVCSQGVIVSQPIGNATKLSIAFPPTSTFTGVQFDLLANVTDSSGNIIQSSSAPVTVASYSDATCSTPSTGILGNSTSINAYQGQALFDQLTYSKVEQIYLKVSSTGLTSACSPAISINTNPLTVPTNFSFYSTPTTEFAGQVFSTQPFSYLQNRLGSIVQGGTGVPITIAAFSDSTCSTAAPGTLSGNTTINSAFGVGAFTNLSYSNSGTIYLGLSSSGLPNACSTAVTINATALSSAAKLKFTTQPSSTAPVNTFLATQPSIEVDDSSGAIVSGVQGFMQLNWYNDATCSSPVTGAAEADIRIFNGTANFSYLGMTSSGTFYLKASFNNISPICSNAVLIGSVCSGTQHFNSGTGVCDPNTVDCSASITNSLSATSTWTGSAYGACTLGQCSASSHTLGNSCPSNTIDCSTTAGTASQTWNGSTYGSCLFSACNQNYDLISSACYASCSASQHHTPGTQACTSNTQDCSASITNSLVANQTWNGSTYGSCTLASCKPGFTPSGNACTASYDNLAISFAGNGTGVVTGTPTTGTGSINCSLSSGSTCSSAFADQANVTLTAIPDYGSYFAGFSGDYISSSSPLSLFMNNAKNLIAKFTASITKLRGLLFTPSTGIAGANAIVRDAAGNTYIGGSFTYFNNTKVGNIIKFKPDGTFDSSFNAGGSGFSGYTLPSYVSAITIDGSGNLIVGGNFNNYNGGTDNADYIAKLSPSGALLKINPADTAGGGYNGVAGNVNALATDTNGNVYVGGSFTYSYIGKVGNSRAYILKINSSGTLVPINPNDGTTFATNGFNGGVSALTFDSSGNLWVGGGFTQNSIGGGGTLGNTVRIAKIDTTGTVQKINPADTVSVTGNGFNSNVNSIVFDSSGNMYAGGAFTVSYIGNTSNSTYSFAKINSSGVIQKINSSDAFSTNGNGFNGTVYSMAIDGTGNIWVGGAFPSTYEGGTGAKSANYIVKFNSSGVKQNINSSDVLSTTGNGFDNQVNALTTDSSGNVYAAGLFTKSYIGAVKKLSSFAAKISPTTGLDMVFNSSSAGFDSFVRAQVRDSSGNLYVGGNFTSYNGVTSGNIAKFLPSGVPDTTFNSGGTGFNSSVNVFYIDSSGNIWVGGSFNSYNGTTVNRLAKLSPTGALLKINSNDLYTGNGNGYNSGVSAITPDSSGNLWIGGSFVYSFVGAVTNTSNNIAKLSSSGVPMQINPSDANTTTGNGFNGSVAAIVIDLSGNIWCGGGLTQSYIGNTTATYNANGIAKISPSGTLLKINPNDVNTASGNGYPNQVQAMLVDSSGNIWIGGNIGSSFVGNVTNTNRFISKLSPSGTLLKINSNDANTSNGNGFDNYVNAISQDSSGNIWVGGNFNSSCIGNVSLFYSVNKIAKISSAGILQKINTSDINTALGNGVSGEVYSIGFDSSGNVYFLGGTSTGIQFSYVGNSITSMGAGFILQLDSSGNVH